MSAKQRTIRAAAAMFLLSFAAVAGPANEARLAEAVQHGDRETVRSLLKQHSDVNLRQADGSTPLAWAVHRNDLETAELLIAAGAKVSVANDYGVTPLEIACINGSGAMVEKLLKAGADPNAAFASGETPLMSCGGTGSAQAVLALLSHGADVKAKDPRLGQTALMWAAAEKHAAAATVLLEHGADVHARSKGGFTPLLFAAQAGDVDTARVLLEVGADVNETVPNREKGQVLAWGRADGMSPLVMASANGREAAAIFLLEHGADPNATDANGVAPLHYALRKGLSVVGAIQYVTALGPNPYASYYVRPAMTELLKALLAHRANPNIQIPKQLPEMPFTRGSRLATVGITPFFLAAAAGDAAAMRILKAAGADPQLPTEESVTPLMVASGMGHYQDFAEGEEAACLEAAKLALELGADVNAASKKGTTALHAAAHIGADAILRFLVSKGADLNAKDFLGQTPWNLAEGLLSDGATRAEKIDAPHTETAKLLVSLGASEVRNLPPPPESAKENFYFRREKGVADPATGKPPDSASQP